MILTTGDRALDNRSQDTEGRQLLHGTCRGVAGKADFTLVVIYYHLIGDMGNIYIGVFTS